MATVRKRFSPDYTLTSARMFGTTHPTWWVGHITGLNPKYIFSRRFLGRPRTNSDARVFRFLNPGDILEVCSGTGTAAVRQYYKIDSISPKHLLLEEVTRTFVLNKFGSSSQQHQGQHSPPPPGNTNMPQSSKLMKSELSGYYRLYIKEINRDMRVLHLANAINWMDRALKKTMSQKQLPQDAPKRYSKVQKLRVRASHETTLATEKEACLLVSLEIMERLVIPYLLPVLNIDVAKEQHSHFIAGRPVRIPKQPPAPPPTQQPGPNQGFAQAAQGFASAAQQAKDILEQFAQEIADAINAIKGLQVAYVKKTAQMNVCIRGERKMAFTIVGHARRMRINCMYLPTVVANGAILNWKTDSKGYHYIIQKPANIQEAKRLAEMVARYAL